MTHPAGVPVDGPHGFGPAVERVLPHLPRLLAFGEPMHGEDEFLRYRNALLAHLVAHAGFRAIAIESSCLHARLVDDYVRHGRGDLDHVMRHGFTHTFGGCPANRELVRLLAEHNRTADEPVRFHGFDAPIEMMGADSPRTALAALHRFLDARVDHLPVTWDRIDALLGADARWNDPAAALDPARSVGGSAEARELRLITDDLRWLLAGRTPESAAEPDDLRDAELAARTAAGLLAYHAGMAEDSPDRVARLLSVRDTMMAENLLALDAPTLVFAHNQHLHRGVVHWRLGDLDLRWHSAGALVAHRLGDDYAVIGSAIGTAEHHGIPAPEPDTVEGVLAALPGTARLVAARDLPRAARPRSTGNHSHFPLDPARPDDYDAVLMLREAAHSG
ncbi:erythromycin esterase family protein [Actinosynnema sp. NPDC047251]|uniref:Erythromycin esterase n=1 Tax=Saccharothrix espanaensis (strain ATCC 51144 / DSM 44229 / JCM 9112 / NBRC 15066 / NRRL 15764) TaxID=1179773 RepID=K0JU37_SACES|nr:erythromycin esterase family protein [Saccharothrix espanaensis]CCH31335.1 Erythromycin esterase [Saccharothrix espanaensis DSM 44229]